MNTANLLLILTLCASAAAQDVTVTGVVKPVAVPVCLGATHELECTDVKLSSAAVDLDGLVGRNVRLTGVLEDGGPCAVVDVASSQAPLATLTTCGNPVPGCPMRFRVGPSGVIGQYWLYVAPSGGFTPIGPQKGSLLLGTPFFLLASGPTFGEQAAVDVTLPADTSLTGVEVFLQGARRDVGPIGPIQFSNAVCFTILGPSPPCIAPDC